jgi:hypothetical protein
MDINCDFAHKILVRDCLINLPELSSMPKADYIKWLSDNFKMYSHFKYFAQEALQNGRKRFSAYMIRERVRWHVNVEYDGEFKISNNLTPYIARTLILDIPALKDVLLARGELFLED